MSVKVMNYSYFLKIISYINTYISVTYTESTVRNVKPQGNHNTLFDALGNLYTVRNVKPQGNHNLLYYYKLHPLLLETLNRKVITTCFPLVSCISYC